jgi:hypothetical protein
MSAIVLATLAATPLALAAWARATPTRALGAARSRFGGAVAVAIAVIQALILLAQLAPLAALTLLAATWMVVGLLFVAALNGWPRWIVPIAAAIGAGGLLVALIGVAMT